jgi:hypothetical protein
LVGVIVLGGAMFVANRMLFINQPGVENVVSIILTIALGVILYKLLAHTMAPKNSTRREVRRNLYGSAIFLCEMMVILVLLFTAILFTVTLSSGENQPSLSGLLAVVGLLALSLPLGLGLLRSLSRRTQQVEEPSDY